MGRKNSIRSSDLDVPQDWQLCEGFEYGMVVRLIQGLSPNDWNFETG
jgi:hypothetical protein